MDFQHLSQPIVYPLRKERWGLLNVSLVELDEQLAVAANQFSKLDESRRAEVRRPIPSKTRWTLLQFAQRYAVVALREKDVGFLETAFRGLSMISGGSLDPRDIMSAISRLRYVVIRLTELLKIDVRSLVEAELAKADERMRELTNGILNREERPEGPFGFREVTTQFGVGLIRSDRQLWQPTCDLLAIAIEIAKLIEQDAHYVFASMQIEKAPPSLQPTSAAMWLIARTDKQAHPDMRHQMFHLRLVELAEGKAEKNDVSPTYQVPKANPRDVRMFIRHERLICTGVARSYVKGVDSVESRKSLSRFERPILAIFENAIEP